MTRLRDIEDGAYGDLGPSRDDWEGVTQTEYNLMKREREQHADEYLDEALERDDDSGYNWGPPPNKDHVHGSDVDLLPGEHIGEPGDPMRDEEHRVGAIQRQSDQWPERTDR